MSWSFTARSVPADPARAEAQIRGAANAALYSGEAGEKVAGETIDQVGQAITRALSLIASGAIGTEGPWQVTCSGHSNPGHGRRDGYANEFVQVHVSEH